jgi:hypothetical protein
MGCLLLSACLPLTPLPPTETPTPTQTTIPTPTIVWFPPSATPTQTAFATPTPIPDMKPGIGARIFSDNFSDELNWDTAVSDQASAIISRNRLSLAVQPNIYIASLRRGSTLKDFYAELTARPSLCRGDDNYGLIVRAIGTYFYRFVLSCNRMVYVERINSGVKLIIFEPALSGDAPAGAPGEVKIGLWASGHEMRLFLNDRFQFSVVDKSFPNGALGLFARSAGDTPMSVTFSDLTVYDVNYIPPTRTPSP